MYQNIKVAAYCRVSTDREDQLNSLSTQISFFNDYIRNHENWTLVEVYYDEGITGTSVKKRDSFNRMIADCEAGKINTILTKEVSRFARNTVDTLNFTRHLSELNINVIFMNDGIDTADKDGELRLTIMASIAQEESRKVSERVKWSMRRKMENGLVYGCGRIYGYKVIDGKLQIVPEEAEIVKKIFHMYLYDGIGSSTIAHRLSEQGIPTLKNRVWSQQHVLKILKNEKYVGDLTQWKVYKPNVLAEKTLVNHGDNPDVPLITVPNHHEPIISREVWDGVQEELKRRANLTAVGKKHSGNFWLSGKVICGKCGYTFAKCRTSNPDNSTMRCRSRIMYGKDKQLAPNGETVGCDAHALDERIVLRAMETIMSSLCDITDTLEQQLLDDIRQVHSMQNAFDPSPLKAEIAKLEAKKQKAIDLMLDELITKDDLVKQNTYYDSEITRLTEEIAQGQNTSAQQNAQLDEIRNTIRQIKSLSEHETGDKEFYRSMIEKIIVPDYGYLTVYLNGFPMAFAVVFSVKKACTIGLFDITIDRCEIIDTE